MIEKQRRKEELESTRRERRKQIRDEDVPENQLCVVCRTSPREVRTSTQFFSTVFIVFSFDCCRLFFFLVGMYAYVRTVQQEF